MGNKKVYVFKQYHAGTAKASGKPFKMLELHDSQTLENTKYYLEPTQVIAGLEFLQLGELIDVEHGFTTFNGQPRVTVENVTKHKVG